MPLSNLAESFAAFFPLSMGLFLVLFLGREHLFPWLGDDLHGKEIWLNIVFLFARDLIGLAVLYGLGWVYLFYALRLKLVPQGPFRGLRAWILRAVPGTAGARKRCRARMRLFAVLYMLAFALVLSLIGFDLVMSMDPHWYSTLFGAYSFVKAFYIGLGGLIVLAAVLHLSPHTDFRLRPEQFHDVGKLFFAFCLVWADFFYCQFVVIWYGNIPEETGYVIARTVRPPWNGLAWTVFSVGFIMPFLLLLNRRIKMQPKAMTVICTAVVVGIWLEHFLLLGPAYQPFIAVGVWDVLMALGFLGLLALAVGVFLTRFPELLQPEASAVREEGR